MSTVEWLLEHSETTVAAPAFAWAYMTNVHNWDDPPAQFELEGSFRAGTRGTTTFPNREPLHWRIRDVQESSSYTIESDIGGALLLCEWSFAGSRGGGTRLTQRVGLSGEDAARHAVGVREAFEPALAAGMRRIAGLLDGAAGSPAAGQ